VIQYSTEDITEFTLKLMWLDTVSDEMKSIGMGELHWDSYFDGVYYSIKIVHVNEL